MESVCARQGWHVLDTVDRVSIASVCCAHKCAFPTPAHTCSHAYSTPAQEVVRLDPELAPFTDHLKYRWSKYTSLKESIKEAEGGLVNFAAVRQGDRGRGGGGDGQGWFEAVMEAGRGGGGHGWGTVEEAEGGLDEFAVARQGRVE